MQYNLINLLGIELGALLGLLLRKRVSSKYTDTMLIMANLCIAVMGIKGALTTQHTLLLMLSAILGGLLGTALQIERAFSRLGDRAKSLIKGADSGFSKAFVTVMLMQCVGSMAIVGPINAVLTGDGSILMFKSVMDFTSSLIYAAKMGPGVLLSGPVVFLYQSIFALLAQVLSPLLSADMIREINAVGSLLIFALSLDLLGILKIKIADYLPAVFIPVLYFLIQ